MRIILILLISIYTLILNAQNLTVPDSILNELTTLQLPIQNSTADTLIYKVVYPTHYDASKTYPVLLGLSGGNQSEKIVNYCYAAWFRSVYFQNYLTILPVNNSDKNLLHYSPADIQRTIATIKNNFKLSPTNWIVIGTSNGGGATFNFIAEAPELFEGGMVIPGVIEDSVNVTSSWSHLKIILAYGTEDSKSFVSGAKQTKKTLAKQVQSVKTLKLKGQGHILPIDFDLDVVYQMYFEKL